MYHRLLARGARGRYVPDLVIYHHVPAARLTKRYFRRWCFWRGVSLGVMDREPARAGRIPRRRSAVHDRPRRARCLLRLRRAPRLRADARTGCRAVRARAGVRGISAGFFWGKHVHRARAHVPACELPTRDVRAQTVSTPHEPTRWRIDRRADIQPGGRLPRAIDSALRPDRSACDTTSSSSSTTTRRRHRAGRRRA